MILSDLFRGFFQVGEFRHLGRRYNFLSVSPNIVRGVLLDVTKSIRRRHVSRDQSSILLQILIGPKERLNMIGQKQRLNMIGPNR